MRGRPDPHITMLAFIDPEERVPTAHPLRAIKRLAGEALAELSPLFDKMYAEGGRPSIPPERLLKASLLIAPYSVRSERAFCAVRSAGRPRARIAGNHQGNCSPCRYGFDRATPEIGAAVAGR
jgi:hypothetical protein